MAQVTLDLPEVLSTFLTASGHDLERAVLEAIALEAYREGKLSMAQLRRLLGYHTRAQVHAFPEGAWRLSPLQSCGLGA